jgi:hypothetical protein
LRALTLTLLALALALAPRAAQAQDRFEIQVYDADTAPKWHPGIEVHTNYAITGDTTDQTAVTTHHVLHLTFEPHLGVASWSEVGFYVQTALRPDGNYDYAGVKGRFKMRVPQRLFAVLGLALNTEVGALPGAYAVARYGAELRPIIDLRLRALYISVNPIFDFDFEGPLAGRPLFEPAAKLAVTLAPNVFSLGVEYYGAIGPVYAPLPASQEVHRLFAVGDLELATKVMKFGLNFGGGYGFAAGERWIVKAIFSMEFGSTSTESPHH